MHISKLEVPVVCNEKQLPSNIERFIADFSVSTRCILYTGFSVTQHLQKANTFSVFSYNSDTELTCVYFFFFILCIFFAK